MNCLQILIAGLLISSSITVGADSKASSIDLKLTLPPAIYAAEGLKTSIYFDNLILAESAADYEFKITCPVGQPAERRWVLKPTAKDVGTHEFKVEVISQDGQRLKTASSVLHVFSAKSEQHLDSPIRLLIIGDSLTHATQYPNELARLLNGPGNPQWKMLGTHAPTSAQPGVVHEGYGGWTWDRFANHFEPNPDGTYRKRSSPFVFLNDEKRPHLNLPRYFQESCDGETPDYIIILLGINDCFSAPPDDPQAIDDRINLMFSHAEKLLEELRKSAPKAEIGVCLTTPPNARKSAFEANYQDKYTRWGWKRIQHRLVQREIGFISSLQDPRIMLVPTELNLDPVDGYPKNNAVHPNASGYQQIGATIYAWLKSRLQPGTE